MRTFSFFFLLTCLSLSAAVAIAQETCPDLVQQALDATDQYCSEIDRNTACYGNNQIEAEIASDAPFAAEGDIVPLADILSLKLAGLDVAAKKWGVTLMRVQADIPDTMPGQAVTFLLFGDVVIENAAGDDSGFSPMQAFYLKTGVGSADCAEAPDGILVQTPEGVAEISLTVNGADVTLGSTAFFQTRLHDEGKPPSLTMSVLEGQGTIEAFGVTQPVFAGSWVRVPIDEDFNVAATPGPPKPYQFDKEDLGVLPVDRLERLFDITPSLTEAQIAEKLAATDVDQDTPQFTQTITNDLADPVTVTIPGMEVILLAGGSSTDVTLFEGVYRMNICLAYTFV